MSCSSHARAVLAALVLVATGCGTPTSTTQLWQAKDVVRAPMRRIAVFTGGISETGRRTLEDGFAHALAERDVAATPAYELFPALPDKEHARAALRAAGYDGVLVSTVRAARERSSYVPATANDVGFWDMPGWGPDLMPGYVVTDDVVSIETRLWDLRANGALVWSADTQTTNPSSTADTATSLTKELLPKLTRSGLIPPKR